MQGPQTRLTARLVDSLYTEAMVLADEARAYFDEHGKVDRETLDPLARVEFTCESLKVTTRLMYVIAWLLTHRARAAGEISEDQARAPARRLGIASDSAPESAPLPEAARVLVVASRDLYDRVRRLDETLDGASIVSPARTLYDRLERAF